jgi:chromosomal replication initiation ATPase DnaA
MKTFETKQERQIKEQIQDCIEEVIGVPRELWVYRRSRKSEEVTIRHIYGYFLKNMTGLTLKNIASEMGHLNHTTIISSNKVVDNWLSVPAMYKRENQIIRQIERLYAERYPECVNELIDQA